MKLEEKVITGLATCDDDAAITIVDIEYEIMFQNYLKKLQ